MSSIEEKLISLLKSRGNSDEDAKRFLEDLYAGKYPEMYNDGKFTEQVLKLLESNSGIGKTTEEKVFVDDNQTEIPFEKSASKVDMVDGVIDESIKKSYYSSTGDLANPVVKIDYRFHRLTESEWYQCRTCERYVCARCAELFRDRYGYVQYALCKEKHVVCQVCSKVSENSYDDMNIVRDELGNIVSIRHKHCGLFVQLWNFLIAENKKEVEDEGLILPGFEAVKADKGRRTA